MIKRLEYFPFTFSAIILGLSGFTLLLQKITLQIFEWDHTVWISSFTVCAVLLTLFFIAVISRALLFPAHIKADFLHPVKGNFFAIPAKIFMIFASIMLPFSTTVATYFWIIGSVWQLTITFAIMSLWIRKDIFHPKHLSPAWFLPIVGNLIVPIAGVPLGFIDISWFFFSIGMFFWIALFAVVFNRIIFHDPMHEKFAPTLFILFAPPAIAAISLGKLTGEFSDASLAMLYLAGFLFIFTILQYSLFKKISFYLSWWAYTFPTAALGLAFFYGYEETHKVFMLWCAMALEAFLLGIIILLIYKTVGAISRHELCVDD